MDSEVDGDWKYDEIVRLVAKDSGVSTDQIEAELEPYI